LLAAVETANGIVDGILRDRYKLPLNEVPGSVVEAATHIVEYTLCSWRDSILDSKTENKYRAAIDFLRTIALDATIVGGPALMDVGTGASNSIGAASTQEWFETF